MTKLCTESRRKTGRPGSEADMLVCENLQVLRERAGLSQTQLADRIGLSYQQIQKYENGKNRITAGRLLEIARALDEPVTSFFADTLPDSSKMEIDGLYRLKTSLRGDGMQARSSMVHIAAMIADFRAIDDWMLQQSISRLIRCCSTRERGKMSSSRRKKETSASVS